MPEFFRLAIGGTEADWHLAIKESFEDGTPVDIWAYRGCGWLDSPKPVPFRVQVDGKRTDVYFSPFSTTVVSRRLAEVLQLIAGEDIQRIPARVDGEPNEWEVLNVVACVDCIDHHQSKITYYPQRHPEKPGKPRGVLKLVLDRNRIGQHHIFHPKDWEVVTVVSDRVKTAMEEIGATGVDYWLVTDG